MALPIQKLGLTKEYLNADSRDQIEALATEVLNESRAQLMMAFRFMDSALWKMPAKPYLIMQPFGSDAETLMFNPFMLLARFKRNPQDITRDYLHTVLHCIFCQPLNDMHDNAEAWYLACDIFVESIALEMSSGRFVSATDEERTQRISELQKRVGKLTPERLYKLFDGIYQAYREQRPSDMSLLDMRKLEVLFVRDDHSGWKQKQDTNLQDDAEGTDKSDDSSQSKSGEETSDDTGGKQGSGKPQDEDKDAPKPHEDKDADLERQQRVTDDDVTDKENDEKTEELTEQWQEIAKQMETDLEFFAQGRGFGSGALLASLVVQNRKRIDFRSFLRRFAEMNEDMCINDDEFDYIFYTYGLKLYKNMPLVEPLEYKETKRVRDFVIALDTSGSCSGELIQTFVEKTCGILTETEGFNSRVNIHIIQCDATIQEEVKITSLEEFEAFREGFQTRGFGGTDFRPVFERVTKLVKQGEFSNLRGLIYFTDGQGKFPLKPPPFNTVFVFANEEDAQVVVPPWAMKVVMSEDEIKTI